MLCSLCKGSHPLWARAIPKSSRSSRRVFEVGEGSTREPPPPPPCQKARVEGKGQRAGAGQGQGRDRTEARARARARAHTRLLPGIPPPHTPWVPGG